MIVKVAGHALPVEAPTTCREFRPRHEGDDTCGWCGLSASRHERDDPPLRVLGNFSGAVPPKGDLIEVLELTADAPGPPRRTVWRGFVDACEWFVGGDTTPFVVVILSGVYRVDDGARRDRWEPFG